MTVRLALATLVVGLVCLSAAPGVEAQCAMCRNALEGSEQGRVMAMQFNHGILFLLGAPFAVAVGVGLAMIRSRRRLRIL